jgi:hypothetical protein
LVGHRPNPSIHVPNLPLRLVHGQPGQQVAGRLGLVDKPGARSKKKSHINFENYLKTIYFLKITLSAAQLNIPSIFFFFPVARIFLPIFVFHMDFFSSYGWLETHTDFIHIGIPSLHDW